MKNKNKICSLYFGHLTLPCPSGEKTGRTFLSQRVCLHEIVKRFVLATMVG